ncbi:hypothetical protein CAL12_24285 [Bordetella genomosp. 8]|uniref:Uncharacterized protein n=1 Tax=Bordetella genomosp. 8 TaxID=1416806 RepID=A0A1W6YRS7_9BORD|nr:hypothetical protein CAL12_24285 [Bordetella genomosp. 8]
MHAEAFARPDDLRILAAHAGLSLTPEHLAELADAWRYIAPMLARIPRDRPYADEAAHTFVPASFDGKGMAR